MAKVSFAGAGVNPPVAPRWRPGVSWHQLRDCEVDMKWLMVIPVATLLACGGATISSDGGGPGDAARSFTRDFANGGGGGDLSSAPAMDDLAADDLAMPPDLAMRAPDMVMYCVSGAGNCGCPGQSCCMGGGAVYCSHNASFTVLCYDANNMCIPCGDPGQACCGRPGNPLNTFLCSPGLHCTAFSNNCPNDPGSPACYSCK
jgi:hypothetical protein